MNAGIRDPPWGPDRPGIPGPALRQVLGWARSSSGTIPRRRADRRGLPADPATRWALAQENDWEMPDADGGIPLRLGCGHRGSGHPHRRGWGVDDRSAPPAGIPLHPTAGRWDLACRRLSERALGQHRLHGAGPRAVQDGAGLRVRHDSGGVARRLAGAVISTPAGSACCSAGSCCVLPSFSIGDNNCSSPASQGQGEVRGTSSRSALPPSVLGSSSVSWWAFSPASSGWAAESSTCHS